MSRTVGILGASGYAGAELLRLLARHPDLTVAWASGDSSAGQPVTTRYPSLTAAYPTLSFCTLDEGLAKGADVIFMALPHGRSGALAAQATAAAPLVLDLAADFRLHDAALYPTWYGEEHPAPSELGSWPYGLPELHRDELAGATKVAVPGCYPTASLLALAPLVRAGVIETDGIVVDAKSGVSGAGRSLKDNLLYAQADENVSPYNVGGHRHTPEIEQELARLAGTDLAVQFTPHLIPMTRGILATCYGRLAPGVTTDDSRACFEEAYGHEPFVDLLPPGQWPRTRAVATTNRAQVAVVTDRRTGRAVAAASIDNLVKGAAGQAIQNANIALGLDETVGLPVAGVAP
jgi:N-acetyl-gamma-glutamyl-phosphate reductase